MKNIKNNKPKKSNCFLLKDSKKAINKHFSELSISIAGEFTLNNAILFQRQFYRSDLEMF